MDKFKQKQNPKNNRGFKKFGSNQKIPKIIKVQTQWLKKQKITQNKITPKNTKKFRISQKINRKIQKNPKRSKINSKSLN